MQVSSLYRRGVVVPVGPKAQLDLWNGAADDTTPVKVVRIRSDEQFYRLSMTGGLFHAINDACESFIGDYEDELIPAEKSECLFNCVDSWLRSHGSKISPEDIEAVEAIRELASTALRSSMPVWFVL
jgi:hypothetical protein